MFVDVAKIHVKAGAGGKGMVSFRRERFVARGGPDGGNGGAGGDVLAIADTNLDTLSQFRHSKLIKADNGASGKRRKQQGRSADDIAIKVPLGTLIWEDDKILADLDESGDQALLAKGGRGGFGNAHFTSSTRQAPGMAELGEPGEEKELVLELKTVADVGLVGLPNAGKSTLLSVISNARPQIADYPFTTLTPNLGIVDVGGASLLVADIPGLIQGASEGKGLGDDFLRHVERTAVLLHLVDATSDDPVADYRVIKQELKNYKIDLSTKPQLVALTKSDVLDEATLHYHQTTLKDVVGSEVFVLSAAARQGLQPILYKLIEMVRHERARASEPVEKPVPVLTLADDPKAWWVEVKGQDFIVKGQKIEGFAKRTDFTNSEAMDRLRDILTKNGVVRELEKQGLQPGSSISIAGKSFEW